ncbi:oncoprotein-induced transcript 3 protein-like [Mytilus trossulus]|uniref:oncoprotein-induced transcript 3 protein-like n=1 Tax=Mytilus trossulus TaxID=6551 RepID=UPI003006EA2A
MCLKLISISVLIYVGHAFPEPCETLNAIDNWKRSAANNLTDNTFLCDSRLKEGWYRITSTAGERMPTECLIGGYRCGTKYPIYLSRKGVTTGEDIFPETGKIVNRTAYEVLDDRCVNEEYPIRIKNCTLYLVYYLRPTRGCPTTYCFGTEMPCPDGQLSQTGFSPGCSNVKAPPKCQLCIDKTCFVKTYGA